MNDLEKQFKAVLDEHGAEVTEAYKKALELSDKYCIPVGAHTPKDFRKKYGGKEGPAPDYEWIEGVNIKFVVEHCKGLDMEYWASSTVECEWGYG